MVNRKSDFIEIPPDFIKGILRHEEVDGIERIADVYVSRGSLASRVFWMRLRMIHSLIRRVARERGTALDFGGGAGIFLPTMSRLFRRVVCIDLLTSEAEAVCKEYRLDNTRVVRADIGTADLAEAPFDAIVAADVLEHFRDLTMPVDRILGWLGPNGILYTSLPTESWLYVMLRKVFRVTKPVDHYHTAAEVEAYLVSRGLVRVARTFVPIPLRVLSMFALFRVTAWRKAGVTAAAQRPA
jgi:2-polyprenyl-3-methyl-5-hydroxy-6-metoxy-1,4-benzoquinol methylase